MKKDGFTLVEIILAIAFLLIVTLMVVPNMYTMIAKTNEKQLAKTEELIKEAAKRYIGEDKNLAYNLKRCGRATVDAVVPGTCVDGIAYKTLYLSLNDLLRVDLLSSNLKDPTQTNEDYDYSKIIEIWYNTTTSQYQYDLKDRQNVTEPNKKTLLTQTFLIEYDYFWYSGLNWRAYKIASTVDGTDNPTPSDSDYIHLYLNEPAPLNLLTCTDLETKLNNYKHMLARRTGGVYCALKDADNNAGTPDVVTVVLKNKQMFVGGTGEVDAAALPTPIYQPFLLLGDYYAKDGQLLGERFVGEYVIHSASTKRIVAKKGNYLELEDGTRLDSEMRIITTSGTLNIGTKLSPYTLGAAL